MSDTVLSVLMLFSSIKSCPLFVTPWTVAYQAPLFRQETSQARILEWVAMPSSRGSSQPKDRTLVSCISFICKHILYHWATWEAWANTYLNGPQWVVPAWMLGQLCLRAKTLQFYLTLCNPMGCSLPGPSIHGILLARILEWVAICFSRGSSQPRDQTRISCIGRQILYHWATRKALNTLHIS